MPTQNQDQPKVLTAEELKKLKENVRYLVSEGANKWTPETIKQADPILIFGAMASLDSDDPSISSMLLPKGMTLQTYDRMLNREMSRREMWPQYYQHAAEVVGKKRGTDYSAYDIPQLGAVLELTRPKIAMDEKGLKFDSTNNVTIKADPMTVAMYDALIDVMITNKSGLSLRDDTADALGYPRRADGKAWGAFANTDVADHRLMYALASLKYFNPTPGVGDATEAAFWLTPGVTNGQLQTAFCRLTPSIYDKGRSSGLPGPRDAGLPGLLEARVDARSGGFETNDMPPDGLFQPCSVPMASNSNESMDVPAKRVAAR